MSISKSARSVRWTVAAALLAALGATVGAVPAARAQGARTPAGGWPQTFGLADNRPAPSLEEQAAPVRSVPSSRFGVELRTVPQVALANLDVESLRREDAQREARSMNKVLRYGVGRAVHATAADGNWYRLAGGGRLWALEIVSPGALGLRLHLAGLRLPQGGEIAIYAPGDPSQAVLYDSDQPSLAGEVWTPTVFGERVRVEVRLPAGAAAGRLPFTLDRVQHLYRDPVAETVGGKAAGSCHNDVTCFPEWANVAKAVGGLGTIFDNNSLYCTGQLLNSQKSDQTPYFLTAHHCLSTQQDATNAEIFWLYQTATCGGTPPTLSSVPRTAGATLLATGPESASDYTLLMILGALPRNLFWAGWTSEPVAAGTASADVHHPAGDYKRISFGDRSPQPADCNGTLADHVRIDWTDGVTEPGSSGSGIFRADTQQLYGQLHCGPSACGESPANLNDSFGAFSATYPHLATFLAGGTDDTFEDNETCEVAHRAAPATYKNLIVKNVDPDWYRLSVPAGKTLTVTISYTRTYGNIGLRLYGDCNGAALAVSNAAGNKQTVTFTNHGSAAVFYRWQAFLRTGVRNTYMMTVAVR